MNENQSGLAYGIIREFEDGTTLWYEPITDEIDGFILRGNKGYIQTVYCEKREAYVADCKDENIIDVFPKCNKLEYKGYCGSVSDKKENPYPIGSIRLDGITPSDEFLEFAEKEKGEEITAEDIQRVFNKKYTVIPDDETARHEKEIGTFVDYIADESRVSPAEREKITFEVSQMGKRIENRKKQ